MYSDFQAEIAGWCDSYVTQNVQSPKYKRLAKSSHFPI